MKLIIITQCSTTDIYLEINHSRKISNYYTLRIYDVLPSHVMEY